MTVEKSAPVRTRVFKKGPSDQRLFSVKKIRLGRKKTKGDGRGGIGKRD